MLTADFFDRLSGNTNAWGTSLTVLIAAAFWLYFGDLLTALAATLLFGWLIVIGGVMGVFAVLLCVDALVWLCSIFNRPAQP